ncbi:DUF2884 family protein [Luteibacter yeojuensis]|uniref:YggN family protein n=1 Tax=Luteibacter yeojuensis TaxID=345309 RepID=A0A7X5QVK2_9GAMM|nr:DUF2884 family protein [Luteibacter yeojuensis]NID16124.1 YggN family protein [Luteibacter yeojuensis]
MRHPFIAGTAVLVLSVAAAAGQARTVGFSTDTCDHDYSTPYDVDLTAAGLSFHRTDGEPAKIFLHDGALRVDGKDMAVSRSDAEALRRYEDGVRKLFPQVAEIAREGVQMGFSAMTSVTLTFADGDQRASMLEKLKRKQAQALREIDEGIGAGHWSANRMTETFAGSVSDSVGELVGSVTSGAVSAALSGDSAKVAALQARAESLDKTMDREMDKRSHALEAKTKAICPRLNELAELQRGWKVRLDNGKPLELMTIKPKHSDDDDSDEDEHKKVASS